MATWVLIIIILGMGSAVTTTDFTSQERCEAAATAIVKYRNGIHAICAQK